RCASGAISLCDASGSDYDRHGLKASWRRRHHGIAGHVFRGGGRSAKNEKGSDEARLCRDSAGRLFALCWSRDLFKPASRTRHSRMSKLAFGLTMMIVGIGGTFLTLAILIWSIEFLKKLFP